MQGYEYITLPLTDAPALPSEFHQSPASPATALVLQSSAGGLGRAKLISVSDAARLAESVMGEFVTSFHRQITAQIRAGKSAWRRIEVFNRIKFTGASKVLSAKVRLLKSAYPGKRGKKGVQRISTRRLRGIPDRGWFTFNGKPAYHGPRGRRPLTEAEWIRRYEARRAKRRSGSPRPSRRKPVKAPPVIGGRPTRALVSPGAHDTVQPRNVYLGNASPDLEPGDFYDSFELDPILIAGDWPSIDPGQV